MKLLAIGAAACLMVPEAGAAPLPLRVQDSRGFRVINAELPVGAVMLTLPADIAAGDTVSGRLSIEPPQAATVRGALVRIGSETFHATREPGSATVHVPAAATSLRVEVLGDEGTIMVAGDVAVGAPATPKPQRELPVLCPRHGLFVIDGRFDGDLTTTDVRVGSEWLAVWAESPRRAVVVGPRKLTGRQPLDVGDGDGDWTAHGSVDVIGVEADPRTRSVKAGETVTLSVRVLGLALLRPEDVIVVDLETWGFDDGATEEALTIVPVTGSDTVTVTRAFTARKDGTFRSLARLRNEVSRP